MRQKKYGAQLTCFYGDIPETEREVSDYRAFNHGAKFENARTREVVEAMIECVEALDHYVCAQCVVGACCHEYESCEAIK